ncbi:MAG: LPS export ABC transporter periplasmic protein LptC [Paucibacter sp.]|nr:LPS export ABC transporter periplasmic protein LptC [Roseateles sp.]
MALAPAAAGVRPAPRLGLSVAARARRWFSAWLPLLLMALLAAGTWWLVKNAPLFGGPTVSAPLRHEPDYTMRRFELNRMGADGRLRMRVEGEALRHYPDTDTMEIDTAEVRAYGNDGRLIVATARRALSNGDGSQVQLLGDVLVRSFDAATPETGQPRLVVRGDFLQAEAQGEILRSHLPVQISLPGSELQVPDFVYEHLKGQLYFGGPAHGRFQPRKP